jgi:hypothetical protein
MKNKLLVAFTLIITHACVFIIAANLTKDSIHEDLRKELWLSNMEVGLGRYIEYRDISSFIDNRNYLQAKCLADVGASDWYENLEACKGDSQCELRLDKYNAKHKAPELYNASLKKFKHYKINNNIRSCE